MKKNIFFHIGIHKTATTWIQEFLNINSSWLKSQNIYYPKAGRGPVYANAHHALVGPYIQSDSIAFSGHTGWVDIKKELEACSQDNFLISTENFEYMKKPEKIKEFLGDYYYKIIVFLRRQDDYLESYYQQLIKDFKPVMGYSIHNFVKSNKLEFLNYGKLLKRWEKAFGSDSLFVRIYDKKRRVTNISLEEEFLSMIIPSFRKDYAIPDDKATAQKKSIDLTCLDILRHLNSEDNLENKYNDIVHQILQIQNRRSEKKRLLSLSDRKKLMKKYDGINRKISEKYFHGKDLFQDLERTPVYKQKEIDQLPEIYQRLIEIVGRQLKNSLKDREYQGEIKLKSVI